MKRTIIYSLLGLFVLILTGCPDNALNYDKSIRFENTSNKNVSFVLGDGTAGGIVYPDTLLPLKDISHFVVAKRGSVIRNLLKYPQDSMFLFVLDPDTIAKYPWEQIREDYNIIKRYDLSWKKLAEENYTVYYP